MGLIVFLAVVGVLVACVGVWGLIELRKGAMHSIRKTYGSIENDKGSNPSIFIHQIDLIKSPMTCRRLDPVRRWLT